MDKGVPDPRPVLPTLEKGGSTPSKKALAWRSASCHARPPYEDGVRKNTVLFLAYFVSGTIHPAWVGAIIAILLYGLFKVQKSTQASHLGSGLSRGEHVVVTPDVEKVGLFGDHHITTKREGVSACASGNYGRGNELSSESSPGERRKGPPGRTCWRTPRCCRGRWGRQPG
jgi:hypothetical protein